MKSKKPSATTVHLSARARAHLATMAARENTSQAQILERLVEKAWEDPDGYYLRTAAIHSFMAAGAVNAIFELLTDQEPAHAQRRDEMLDTIAIDARGLFGQIPLPPPEAPGLPATDPRVEALLRQYRFYER